MAPAFREAIDGGSDVSVVEIVNAFEHIVYVVITNVIAASPQIALSK